MFKTRFYNGEFGFIRHIVFGKILKVPASVAFTHDLFSSYFFDPIPKRFRGTPGVVRPNFDNKSGAGFLFVFFLGEFQLVCQLSCGEAGGKKKHTA